jgi:hypothetical protein
VIQRLKRLGPQRRALELAISKSFEDNNGEFDRTEWRRAWASDEPEDILTVKGVTSLFEGLVNHLVEMLHVAARLRGLPVAMMDDDKPSGPQLFAAVRSDGGVTENQVEVLTRIYSTRNELQHSSPGVEADDIYDDVILIQKTLNRFAQTYVVWLEKHGILILPKKTT